MDIAGKIHDLRISRGLTLEEVGNYVGVSKATVLKWESGKIKNMRRDKIVRLAEILGTSPGELIGWTPEPSPSDPLSLPDIFPIRRKSFPLLGDIACGEPTYAEEEHESWISSSADIDADFCLVAQGDSMTGASIDDGDIVFIKQMDVVPNGYIAVVLIGDEATLKYIDYRPETSTLILTPANPAYRTQIYQGPDLDQIRILGMAVTLQKNLMRHSK